MRVVQTDFKAASGFSLEYVFIVLICLTLSICFLPDAAAVTNLIEGGGILSSIEADGKLVINGRKYEISKTAEVLDSYGLTSSLDKYMLPTRVYFEYVQTNEGPSIKLIKEKPE